MARRATQLTAGAALSKGRPTCQSVLMATGKKDGDREAELEAVIERISAGRLGP
jgi:hypothetical protein